MLVEKGPLVEIIDRENTLYYVFFSKQARFETKIHQHQKAQLLYAEGGIVHVFINDRHWYLPARCYMWIPATIPHSILSYSKNIELMSFYFREEHHQAPFYQEPNIYFASDLLREMFLFARNWEGPIYKENETACHFLLAIKSILPNLESNKLPFSVQHPFPKDEKLKQIASYLLKNIHRNYTIEEISETFGISKRTLTRQFKTHLGMNFVRFSRSLRMTKALELIAEGKLNMLEIALSIGYSSVSSFSSIFFKVTGLRPTDYAKLLYHGPEKRFL